MELNGSEWDCPKWDNFLKKAQGSLEEMDEITDIETYGSMQEYISDSETEVYDDEDAEIYEDSVSSEDVFTWSQTEQEPPQFEFNENCGLKLNTQTLTIEDFVDLFFTNDFLTLITTHTNLKAREETHKRGLDWKDVDNEEMKLFFGVLLHMSYVQLRDFWSEDPAFEATFWRSIISYNRLRLILLFLRIAEFSYRDLFNQIRPVLNHFNRIMQEIYVPHRTVFINRTTIFWLYRKRGDKYGVKFHKLCDENDIIIKLKMYGDANIFRKTTEDVSHMDNAPEIVLELMDQYLDKGYTLFMDCFYNSVSLTKELTARKTYVCGTLRYDQKENPRDLVLKTMKRGETAWTRHESVVVCRWKKKRDHFAISNMHKVKLVKIQGKHKDYMKLNVFKDCETEKFGSSHDETFYKSFKKSFTFPNKVLLNVLEIYLQNVYFLYKNNVNSRIKCYEFREKFDKHLIGDKFPSKKVSNSSEN